MMPVAKCWRVGQTQALGRQDAHVLEIALAPAPVARRDVDQRGRAFLVASRGSEGSM